MHIAQLLEAPSRSAHLLTLPELPPARGTRSEPALAAAVNPLQHVKARLHVSVGSTTLTVGELTAAQAQDVLVLDRSVDDAVDLLLDGHVVARGQLVGVDGCFAIRITELPVDLRTTTP